MNSDALFHAGTPSTANKKKNPTNTILKETQQRRRHDEWDEWFQPLTELKEHIIIIEAVNNNDKVANNNNINNNRVEDANAAKRITKAWNHSLYHPPRGSKQYLILFYHVMKTGGSTLYEFFHQLNIKNGFAPYFENVPGLDSQAFGLETPGKLRHFETWRNKTELDDKRTSQVMMIQTTTTSTTPSPSNVHKLTLISFREPVERVMSHYFQLKPCPDGTGGGHDQTCREAAQEGVEAYLDKCSNLASNLQSQYVDNIPNKIRTSFDFVLRSDHMEESFVLMSLLFRIPILDMVLLNSYKIRIATTPLTTKHSFQSEGGCTKQWMNILVNESIRQSIPPCASSCAGLWGKAILSNEQLQAVKERNALDMDLWYNHVLPLYNQRKQRILEQYRVSQDDLDVVLDTYKQVQTKLKEILPTSCKRFC